MDTQNNNKICRGLLVLCDPDNPSQMALERAINLAESAKAPLTVVHSLYSYPTSLLPFLTLPQRHLLKAKQMQQAQEALDNLLRSYRHRDVEMDTRLLWRRDASSGIIALCEQLDIDLVVVDRPPRHRWFDRLWPSVDHQLLRDSPTSLLLVGQSAWPANTRVLSAVDTCHDPAHNHLNDRVIEYTLALSSHLHADVHLCNAYPGEALSLAISADSAPPSASHPLKQDHQAAVNRLAQRYDIPVGHTHVVEGLADDALPETAEAISADLLVVGHSGRHGIAGSVLGNTCEFLLDRLHCDMLSVRDR